MHPEIREMRPGACPKCGMALERATVSLEDGTAAEAADMKRRFWIGAVLTVPVLFLNMRPDGGVISAVLCAPVVFWAGWPFLQRGWDSIRHRSPNMFTLISLGTLAAYFYSLAAILFPGGFPSVLSAGHGHIPLYFEAAAMVTVLVLLGQVLELGARKKTGDALRSLLKLAPTTAFRRAAEGTFQEIPLQDVRVGDVLQVRPGDHVPVDGKVREGKTFVDESMVTGEPVPVSKGPGDGVTAGTVNGSGSFELTAERVGDATLLARIVQSVAGAQRSQAPSQKLADRVSYYFVPAVVGTAIVTFFIWMSFGPEPRLAFAVVSAVSVLIIACPCALGLATPMAVMVAMGRAASAGVLFRNAEALERLASIDVLVVDKTGTLTEGYPRVTAVKPAKGFSEAEVLRWAGALASKSEHPLSSAISQYAGGGAAALEAFESIPGEGVRALFEGRKLALGRDTFVSQTRPDTESIFGVEAGASTHVFLGVEGALAARLSLTDAIKTGTRVALDEMRAQGVQVCMLTGDRLATAKAVASELGIETFVAGILPEEKLSYVRRLQKQGHRVAMAGDGINDAPALSQAEVGIAMGTGSGIALESASVTLIQGDLKGIGRARKVSRAAVRNMKQNLWLAFLYNGLGVPIAAGVLYPFTGILLNPMFAGAAMSLSSVSVIANALRLRRLRVV